MNNQLKNRSGIFLMEIMISILFFSICAAICVQIFAKAHILSRNGYDTSHALLYSSSVLETVEAGNGDLESIKTLFDGSVISNDELTIYYDKEWHISDEVSKKYEQKLTLKTVDGMLNATVVTFDGDNELYRLSSSYYKGVN